MKCVWVRYKATLLTYTDDPLDRENDADAGASARAAAVGLEEHEEHEEKVDDYDGDGERPREFAIRVARAALPYSGLGNGGSSGTPERNMTASSTFSVVDPARPDWRRFPLFARATPVTCVAEAGDLLFVPSMWWHEVGSRGDASDGKAAAVNWWFRPWYRGEDNQ